MVAEFHLFLPQMRMTPDVMADRAVAAEAAGFTGIALMDHLWAPMAEQQPTYEALVTATWIAARTSTLTVGHLVLCDAFRHPVQLAKEAITLDHASGGRFELGIGWGSVPTELDATGLGGPPSRRVARLRETLELLRQAFTGAPLDIDGTYATVHGPPLAPPPLGRLPIVIGGAGPKTLALAEFADWWNLPIYALDRLEEVRDLVGVPLSTQQMVALVRSDQDRSEVEATTERRFGAMHPVVGSAAELVDHYGRLIERGVQRFYVWSADFGDPATLAEFGTGVIDPLR
jgi:alkanesulfonate monooxygenase SsuD/methylene tetrahydromethanopterin reductase-like flavin-dependent oxidoreductase (luciferase family)